MNELIRQAQLMQKKMLKTQEEMGKKGVTVRGAGTGNYGQCVPLAGGLVLDITGMQRVLELAPGRVRVQGGARMHDIEMAARETGQALRMWPSTWRVVPAAPEPPAPLDTYDPHVLMRLSAVTPRFRSSIRFPAR